MPRGILARWHALFEDPVFLCECDGVRICDACEPGGSVAATA